LKKERVIELKKGLVYTEDNEYHGHAIVIATGTRPRELGVQGEAKFSKNNKGVCYFCTQKEQFRDRITLIAGGGDTAVDAALDLVNVAKKIYVAHRKGAFRAVDENIKKMEEADKVSVLYNTELEEIRGNEKVEKVVLINNKSNKKKQLKIDTIIIAVGLVPNADIFTKLGLELDEKEYIVTDDKQRTKIEGIFAVGDIAKGSPHQLAVCAAHGAIVAQKIYEYIKEPYWAQKNQK
jgi:thioredoxin reductase (NADPH)